jgi:DNA repair exonuclease SbcCD ATPase subunit
LQTLKAKRNEEELEETRSQLPSFEQELAQQKTKLENLQKRAEEAEASLKAAKAAFDQEKKSWQAELLQRVEDERHKWQEEAGSFVNSRAESPAASMRRGLTTEYLGLQNLQLRRASARSVNSDQPLTPTERILGRRPSAAPLGKTSGNGTPQRNDSMLSFPRENGDTLDTPSIHNTENDDFFEHVMSPASPRETLNDMVSVSTAGAGPSVQLIERMSSAVRRLESEKAATKEDLTRLAAQRDEARAEIVSLMREVQVKRDQESRIAELENSLKDVNARYETTLEMLGEKSELVDELKSDIDDIKAMYRELVERTVE